MPLPLRMQGAVSATTPPARDMSGRSALEIRVSSRIPHITVSDIDDLRKLAVVVTNRSSLVHIGAFGTVDGHHVWLDIEGLRVAGRPTDQEWDTNFRSMIAYAASKGWIDSTGTHVRAHIEVGSAAR